MWTLPGRQRSPLVLVILVAVAAGFVVQTGMGVDAAVDRFGVNSAHLRNGEWYRLFSASYLNLHGLWHVAVNLAIIAAFGPFLEAVFGWLRTVTVWLVGSICAWTVMMVAGTDASTGAGSSAGATALLGAGFIVACLSRDERAARIYAVSVVISMAIILLVDLDGVSVHAGGFAGGAVLVGVLRRARATV